ncbi:histidine phosphatase family protein [Corallococcus llansteffanensis]|uniref:Histidine phosphatase family protein n=1 Tax=Corallococcus llansteffanensis TaxID=2316731 RepID=A0A3A8Q9J9_9BACT|nr:histidine phosphatase family protein [Corallococcus llansteffanensis]RKH62885.1 histidine phosphatase family protein [Corallococcus llansteffanensis]
MGVIYLVRHGQASFGAADYDKLSELGVEQARVLGESLRSRLPRVDVVVTGTMLRHRETAAACLQALGVEVEPRRMAGFDEFDHEEVVVRHMPRYADAGVLREELATTRDPRRAFQELFTQAVARWVQGGHDGEYKESWAGFKARCLEAMNALVATLGPSKTALVFTSGGPITAVSQELLGIPDEHAFRTNWTLANCGMTKVLYSERGRYLSTLNEHGHFEGEHRALITYR